jgi:hypothetical protein
VTPYVPNVMACLVHEPYSCAVDLVRNLEHLAPESAVVVYVDRPHLEGFAERWPGERLRAVLHPDPRAVPVRRGLARTWWFAVDTMRFALDRWRFDALTIVDSDQLLVRSGFTETILAALRRHPRCALLGSQRTGTRQGSDSELLLARRGHEELALWRPFLDQFPGWEDRFVQYSFWPSMVLAGRAVPDLVRWADADPGFEAVLAESRITAVIELLLPTLLVLLGWEIRPSPASFRHCHWREALTVEEVRRALTEPDCFWIHPVPRMPGDAVRTLVRSRHDDYGRAGER